MLLLAAYGPSRKKIATFAPLLSPGMCSTCELIVVTIQKNLWALMQKSNYLRLLSCLSFFVDIPLFAASIVLILYASIQWLVHIIARNFASTPHYEQLFCLLC